MREKKPKQKFDETLKNAKALSAQLKKDIKNNSDEYKRCDSWSKTYRQGQNRSKAEQYEYLASEFKEQMELAKAKKTILDESIAIAEKFYASVKNSLPEHVKGNYNEIEMSSFPEVDSGAYKAEAQGHINTGRLLKLTNKLNEMIEFIDPSFNYKKIPGIFLTAAGGITTLAGLGIFVALGKFALYGVYLAWVIATPLSLPATLIGVGIAVLVLGGILWWAAAKSDPPERTIKNMRQELTALKENLAETVESADVGPELAVEGTEGKGIGWQPPVLKGPQEEQQKQPTPTATPTQEPEQKGIEPKKSG